MKIDDGLKEIISFKEDAGMCFWFRPNKSYKMMSDFFSKIQDPMDKNQFCYSPLRLEDFWWCKFPGS